MRTTTYVRRRATALLAAGVLAAGLGVFLATPAWAATSLGTLTITPASGVENTGMSGELSASCPAGSTGQVGFVDGPGLPAQGSADEAVIDSRRTENATTFFFSGIFLDVFQSAGIAAPNGSYTVRIACIGADFVSEVGQFAQHVYITPRTGSGSTVNFVTGIGGPVTLTGGARVGGALTCSTPAIDGATQTYAWLSNGAATGVSAPTVTVPASWYNANVTCKVTTSKDGESSQWESSPVKITLGPALVPTVAPKVLGKPRVGKILTCSPGTWSPSAASYKYLWFRGAKALTTKTKSKYKVVSKDLGKKVTCRVTASTTGYASGVAKAPARKVR